MMKKHFIITILVVFFTIVPQVMANEVADYYGTYKQENDNQIVRGYTLEEDRFEVIFSMNNNEDDEYLFDIIQWKSRIATLNSSIVVFDSEKGFYVSPNAQFIELAFSDEVSSYPIFKIVVHNPKYYLYDDNILQITVNKENVYKFKFLENGTLEDEKENIFSLIK